MTIKRTSSGAGLPAGFPFSFLYVQVLLAGIADYGDISAWWHGQFPDPAQAPTRLTFQAGGLPSGAKIEFQAVAAVGGS